MIARVRAILAAARQRVAPLLARLFAAGLRF
jgi:hypothetical protein